MSQLPTEDNTPFSLPHDVPKQMPLDFPALNGNIDRQEAYDEGLDDIVDIDPYREDDDAIKSTKRLMKASLASHTYYTTNPDIIRRWVEYRYGYPAHIIGIKEDMDKGGLFVVFEDDEPEIWVEIISWQSFFRIFNRHRLAFVYRTKTISGAQSKYYRFMDRRNVERLTDARRIV